ncbi:roadblock/LC7 domain-containing protein [Aquimarina algiphila]|uniref:roadblock/LC7 domain-containing protein n=1 Tax=Aquimarina algiphila TaxID=2047982 RepID=UPI00232C1B22|nr:roadblock/LC7 domain-containing protein [Aquimarina algiphila]
MIKSKKIDLDKVLKSTNADAVLIMNNDGIVLDSLYLEYENNIALMTKAFYTMCNDLSKDLEIGEVDQIMTKSAEGFFIANRLDEKSIIISVSKDISKIGLSLKLINSLK